MTLVSYAQNFEDVMLYRALCSVTGGTYVDVGAHDPNEYSVTKLFYERGWRGINVEPVAEYFHRLEAARPEDINLNVAAGAVAGTLEMYVVPGTGLSTAVAEYAASAATRGYPSVLTTIAVATLDEICRRLSSPNLHFLKVDVEGAEADVLRGIDFESTRPWIVVVEATRPGTTEVAYQDWEPLLTTCRYRFVYFDGLNRFYVAEEHIALADAFNAPPNVFDEFVLSRQLIADQQLADVDQWIDALPAMDLLPDVPGRIDHLKARFAGIVNLCERLAAERSGTETLLRETATTLAVQTQRQLELTDVLQAGAAERVALADELNAGAVERAALADELNARAVERAALADELNVGALERAALSEKMSQLQSNNANLVAELLDRDTTITALEGQIVAGSDRCTAALAALNAVLGQLEQDLSGARAVAASRAQACVETESEVGRLGRELQEAAHRYSGLEQCNAALDTQVGALRSSRSWRMTAPLRAVKRLVTGRD